MYVTNETAENNTITLRVGGNGRGSKKSIWEGLERGKGERK